jgi:hypothetical protein
LRTAVTDSEDARTAQAAGGAAEGARAARAAAEGTGGARMTMPLPKQAPPLRRGAQADDAALVAIPAELLATVRAGAYRDLDGALREARGRAADLDRENPAAREQAVGLMGGVDDARAFLDRIGWTGGRDEGQIEIDLSLYHPALQAALLDRLAEEEGRMHAAAGGGPAHAEAADRIDALRTLLDDIGPFAPDETEERPEEARVLLVLLSETHEAAGRRSARWWTTADVETALDDLDPETVRCALDGLAASGAAVRNGELARASESTLRIHALGLIDP